MSKRNSKAIAGKRAVAARVPATAGDDTRLTALDLPGAPLPPEMAAYFAKCDEKLGFVPNVLKAYAFDGAKLAAFVAMYND
ncbi:MAG TPA: alkylhydroperoxidase, partial [Roseiarcus sp.]|nr:alkylhydroperoxidase [Roseiarcus sp.]